MPTTGSNLTMFLTRTNSRQVAMCSTRSIGTAATAQEIVEDFAAGRYLAPFRHYTGIRVTGGRDGQATCVFPTSLWLANGYGTMFGGALALLADIAMNSAVLTRLPKATSFAPLDLKVNFLRPVFPGTGDVIARATTVHRGRSVAVVSCELRDAKDKPVAIGGETVLVLPGRAREQPVHVAEETAAGLGTDLAGA
jgi:uncharacterized protein (TIGR00369 family)